MSYRKEAWKTGEYYHLYNRGVAKQPIFLFDDDYKIFIARMFYYRFHPNVKDQQFVNIECYCLMPNHFHLVVKQTSFKGIHQYLKRMMVSYAMYFNREHCRVGPLYQGRTQSKHVKNSIYFAELSRYIHRNPSDISSYATTWLEYPYSSSQFYLKNPKAKHSALLSLFGKNSENYLEFLQLRSSSDLFSY